MVKNSLQSKLAVSSLATWSAFGALALATIGCVSSREGGQISSRAEHGARERNGSSGTLTTLLTTSDLILVDSETFKPIVGLILASTTEKIVQPGVREVTRVYKPLDKGGRQLSEFMIPAGTYEFYLIDTPVHPEVSGDASIRQGAMTYDRPTPIKSITSKNTVIDIKLKVPAQERERNRKDSI